MQIWTSLVSCILMLGVSKSSPLRGRETRSDSGKYLEYLNRFGYIKDKTGGVLGELVDQDSVLKTALTSFQEVWNLPITGELDAETLKLMNTDRCGNSDDDLYLKVQGITKRYVASDAWCMLGFRLRDRYRTCTKVKTDLTYKITRYSSKLTREELDNSFRIAFGMWSNSSNLSITKTDGWPDIEVKFVTYYHGDDHPFDGRGGTLAHAYFPINGGDLHVDDDEPWVYFNSTGREVTQSVLHEIGHSLGLAHSNVYEAIMYPFYRYRPNLKLAADDIRGIQAIYGGSLDPAITASVPTTTDDPPSVEKWCREPKLDALIYTADHQVYAFQGDEMAILVGNGIKEGYPVKASVEYPKLQGKIDAAILLPTVYGCRNLADFQPCQVFDQNLFKGRNVMIYRDGALQQMRRITNAFPGVPSNINAVFTRDGGNTLYFTKGELIYRHIRGAGVDRSYPKKITEEFPEFPPTIDAALSYPFQHDGLVYYINMIFSGTNYYMLSPDPDKNSISKVPPSFPRPIRLWWLNCPNKVAELVDYSNPTLDSAKSLGHAMNWGRDLVGLEKALPRGYEYFDKDNKLLDLTGSQVPVVQDSRQMLIDRSMEPIEAQKLYAKQEEDLQASAPGVTRYPVADDISGTQRTFSSSLFSVLLVVMVVVFVEK